MKLYLISCHRKYIKLLTVSFAIIYLQKCLIYLRIDKAFLFPSIQFQVNHIYCATVIIQWHIVFLLLWNVNCAKGLVNLYDLQDFFAFKNSLFIFIVYHNYFNNIKYVVLRDNVAAKRSCNSSGFAGLFCYAENLKRVLKLSFLF